MNVYENGGRVHVCATMDIFVALSLLDLGCVVFPRTDAPRQIAWQPRSVVCLHFAKTSIRDEVYEICIDVTRHEKKAHVYPIQPSLTLPPRSDGQDNQGLGCLTQ